MKKFVIIGCSLAAITALAYSLIKVVSYELDKEDNFVCELYYV